MFLQGSSDIFQLISISEIIGACLATFFAILTWYLIERLNDYFEWRKTVKGFNELYKILLAKKYEPDTSIEVVNVILEDIGEKNLKKIVKLNYIFEKAFHKFEGNDFMIEALVGIAGNHLKIYQYNMPIFDFRKPEEGAETHQNFIEYFQTQCRREKVKLKK